MAKSKIDGRATQRPVPSLYTAQVRAVSYPNRGRLLGAYVAVSVGDDAENETEIDGVIERPIPVAR